MPDTPNSIAPPAPPPGFSPVPDQSAAIPPPPGFKPVESAVGNPAWDLTTPKAAGGSGPAGVAIGFGKGALQTLTGAGELVNKVAPIIPQSVLAAGEKIAEPQNATEHLGNFIENAAEFATGEELLKGLSRVAELEKLAQSSPIIKNIVDKTPRIFKNVASGATKGAVVGGAQGATKGAAEGDALGGAEGGAIGGAVGGAATEGISSVAKPIAKKMGIATSAEEDIMRAAKPGKRNEKFLADWDIAKERYAKEMDANGQYEDLNEAAERMREQRQDLWNSEVAPKIAKHVNEDVFPMPPAQPGQSQFAFTNPISDAIRAKASPAMTRLSPKSAKAIETIAKRFDGLVKVGELEQNIEHLNAELTTEGFYKMSASERAAAVKANPSLAAKSAAVEASRDQLYNHLEKAGEPDIQELKRTYGAMRNVENEVRGQVNVASRQNPISLKQIIAIASGHPVGIAATIADKIYNDPAAILNRAVGKNIPDGALKSAAKDVVSGTATVTKKVIPAAGAELGRWIKFQGGDGKTYVGPENQWDEIKKTDPKAQKTNN